METSASFEARLAPLSYPTPRINRPNCLILNRFTRIQGQAEFDRFIYVIRPERVSKAAKPKASVKEGRGGKPDPEISRGSHNSVLERHMFASLGFVGQIGAESGKVHHGTWA